MLKIEVKLTGLWLEAAPIFLNIGITLAYFQSDDKVPLFSDLLNRSRTELNLLTDLIIVGHLSGSGDLLLCKAVNLVNTCSH